MVVKTTVCYIVHCDVCDRPIEHDYIPHHATKEDALSDAPDADWWVWEDHIWCPNCLPLCVCGHVFGEHDFGEAPCGDCSCKSYSPEPESKEANA